MLFKKKEKTYYYPLDSSSYVPMPLPGWNETKKSNNKKLSEKKKK